MNTCYKQEYTETLTKIHGHKEVR